MTIHVKILFTFEPIFRVPQINLHLNEAYTKDTGCPNSLKHTHAVRGLTHQFLEKRKFVTTQLFLNRQLHTPLPWDLYGNVL